MWRKLGFDIDEKRADIKATLWVGEKLILRTYRSHGSGKLSGNIPHKIRTQMKLNERQFKDAIDCPLTKEAYFDILREKGALLDA